MSDHRLPTSAAPDRYTLEIEVDADRVNFRGRAVIDLMLHERVDALECNAVGLTIESASVRGVSVEGVEVDADRERLQFRLASTVDPGPATLEVDYTGQVSDGLVGFYRSTYDDDGDAHTLGVTQFQAPYARTAFPCWDEPSFKARFAVTLIVPSEDFAVSNGAEASRVSLGDGRDRVEFAETIPMSSYLVAWVIGRLIATDPVDADGTPIRMVCRPGQESYASTALDIAAHAVRWFERYYALPYPTDKMDLVALPDFAFGAMENLGCITFREVLLILDPDKLTQPEFERAATVIAHEIAHMWFGDLVTMEWWEGIWLNEAFATFMELCCTDSYRPEWSVWTTFGFGRSQAFTVDGTSSTRPIEFEVQSPADAEAMFDLITYEKGAAVLRMVEQYVGAEPFRAGIRNYLAEHQYSNTQTRDLWTALDDTTSAPLSEIMSSWIYQGGHPVVTASAEGATLRLSQRPYAYAGVGDQSNQPDDRTWLIPVRVRADVDGDIVELKTLVGADGSEVEFAAPPRWASVNAFGDGFYRSRYDTELHRSLTAAASDLPPLERFQLVDDAWALMLSGDSDLSGVIDTMLALRRDENPAVLRRVVAALVDIQRLGGSEHAGTVADLALDIADSRTSDHPEVAGALLRIAGAVGGDTTAIAMARDLDRSSARAGGIHPELAAAALEIVATHGDAADFDRFLESFKNAATPPEEQRYLAALSRFGDPALQDRLFEMCFDEIRAQNAPYTLALSMGHPVHGRRAWECIRDRWDDVVERFPSNSLPRMIGGVRNLWVPEVADDVVGFFDGRIVRGGERTIAQYLDVLTAQQHVRSAQLAILARSGR
jgi:puromycin-sensitive aminopeptidase